MVDQCKHCTARGDLKECMSLDCSHHDNWFANAQQDKIGEMKILIIDLHATIRAIANNSSFMLTQADEDRKRLGI